MIDLSQWKKFVVRPALELLATVNPAMGAEWAVSQVTGTLKESAGLTYLYQVPNGPAMGPYQMEPATHDDIWKNFLAYQPVLRAVILSDCPHAVIGGADLMLTDMHYATLLCRVDYWRSKLTAPGNVATELAQYHKDVYNTSLGASVAADDVAYYQLAIAA